MRRVLRKDRNVSNMFCLFVNIAEMHLPLEVYRFSFQENDLEKFSVALISTGCCLRGRKRFHSKF